MEEIAKTRLTGYAISDLELTMDLSSIAVPLISKENRTQAVINVSVPFMKINDPGVFEQAKTRLFEKREMISRNLGYQGSYPKVFVNQKGVS